jgi:radical SAM superfamily enzyme YgiQ (UPF0313 family)
MRITLVTSPHLDHSALHRADRHKQFPKWLALAQNFVPMGLLSLAGQVARKATVAILDVNKGINVGSLPMSSRFYDDTAAWLLGSAPDLIGFMTEADSYHHIVRLASAIKSQARNMPVLIGGPHASAVHYETISTLPQIDYVIRGEGEPAFEALVTALQDGTDLSGVGNLTFRQSNGEVLVNPELPLISDLDLLPWPDLSRIDLQPEDVIYLEVGRGCPFRCNFCFTAPYWKRKHRIKSAERLIQEITYARDSFGRRDFNFTHDLLTTDRRWVIDFCKKASSMELGVTWTCSSRTDTLDEEQIFWMHQAGCRDIYFGVEAGTPEMQRLIDKNLDLGQARNIIKTATTTGIGATVGFIAGLPHESAKTLSGTLREAFYYLSLPQTTVHVFGFSPYKGSAHFETIKEGLVLDERFADFPLPQAEHTQNVSLMRKHPDIFARYATLLTFEGLPEGIVRASEEFFPIVNALRSLMLRLWAAGLEPLDLLLQWRQWISANNEVAETPRGRLQGTIEQFLDFLDSGTASIPADNITAEVLRWERAKNALRCGLTNSPESIPFERDSASSHVVANPSIILDAFSTAPEFAESAPATRPSTFAFYTDIKGNPAIARIGDLACTLIKLLRAPMERGQICEALRQAAVEVGAVTDERLICAAIGELEQLHLLLRCRVVA